MTQASVRVLAASRRVCLLDTLPAPRTAFVPPAVGPVVCGDRVLLDPDSGGERIASVLPRTSALVRARTDGHDDAGVQLLAANVDVLGICVALDRPLRAGFIERAVAVARATPARPLVLLTKRDVCADLEAALAEAQQAAPMAEIVAVSAWSDEDVELVRALVAAPETIALLGASGAGKSTLANALLGAPLEAVGAVRADDGRGRHTTTRARLRALPHGAWLMDMPGVRALGLVADEDDIAAAFPEIDALAAACRFRDCAHIDEPGCAVTAAVASGALAAARVASWHKLRRDAARRTDALAKKRAERTLTNAAWQHVRDKRRR